MIITECSTIDAPCEPVFSKKEDIIILILFQRSQLTSAISAIRDSIYAENETEK